ncbi:MAG TPA: hypothetical protein VFX94_04050 [Burkholderiales bacterium]|nr:hypothetical protein [Burkholderiales bacterium]
MQKQPCAFAALASRRVISRPRGASITWPTAITPAPGGVWRSLRALRTKQRLVLRAR